MIDIVTKNVRQVGTPSEEDRIYISDKAYRKIRIQDFSDKKVFVFMGHTESAGGRYATFIEAAIDVTEIAFEQNLPVWTTKAWSEVFREVKRSYDESIIVGWALDLKGYSPKVSPELQAIHKEHFGGAHQLLMLLDTAQNEEAFYLSQIGGQMKRTGFFIYYKVEDTPTNARKEVELEVPDSLISTRRFGKESEVSGEIKNAPPRARYRQSINSSRKYSNDLILNRINLGKNSNAIKVNKGARKFAPIAMVATMAFAIATASIITISKMSNTNNIFANAIETDSDNPVQVIEINKYKDSAENKGENQVTSQEENKGENQVTSQEENKGENQATSQEENKGENQATSQAENTVEFIPVEKVPQ